MSDAALGQRFLNHEPIEGLWFEHNEYVLVADGPHAGQHGSLVAIVSMSPEPRFALELEAGFDVEVVQSQLWKVEI